MSGYLRSSPFPLRGAWCRNVPAWPVFVSSLVLLWGVGCASPSRFTPKEGVNYSLGMFHPVSEGDTIQSVGAYYRRDPILLAWFNELKSPYGLHQGTFLYIPPSNDGRLVASGQLKIEQVREARRRLNGGEWDGKAIPDKYAVRDKQHEGDKTAQGTKTRVEQHDEIARQEQEYSDKEADPSKKQVLASVPRKRAASTVTVKAASLRSPPAPTKPTVVTPKKPVTLATMFGAKEDYIWPLDRFTYMRGFSTSSWKNSHKGVDLAAEEGSVILAARSGRVLFSGNFKSYGNMVVLDHSDKFSTLYAHAQRLLVKEGQSVKQGQPIALVGETGRATGPHVHLEMRYTESGVAVNPEQYLPVLKIKDREVVMNR